MRRRFGLLLGSAAVVAGISFAPFAIAQTPFPNRTAAKAAGYCDIPSSSPYYQPKLDRDKGGRGCEC